LSSSQLLGWPWCCVFWGTWP